jgi:pimeloyl-ACP methyl ester carboxylesterase
VAVTTPVAPRVVTLVPIHGTWSNEWIKPGSEWRIHMGRQGCAFPGRSFEWSGDVAGLPRLFSWWATDKHSDWRAGGSALSDYLRAVRHGDRHGLPYEARNIIAHSHGGQVALFAAAKYDTWIRRLITVGTPCREDLAGIVELARPNIGYWLHVCSADGDLMARLGQLFDGRVRRGRTQPRADMNVELPKVGHTKLLDDPRFFDRWVTENLLEFVRASDEQIGARRVVR